ncbi:MAG: hypothetical protein RIC95_10345 [Vicingaceae bacterium]
MKKHFTFFLMCLFAISAFAQTDKPHFVSLNIGTNIPIGQYQKLDSIASGTASSGLYYSFETGLYLSKFFGIGANLGAFANPVDDGDIEDQLRNDLGAGSEYEINSKDWLNAYALVGPYFTFGTDAIRLDLKFLAGIINSQKPLINVTTMNSGQVVVSRNEEATATSFGFNYGLHLRIKLVGKLGLRLNAEGFSTQQEFESKVVEESNGSEQIQESTIEKEIQALNLGAGLVLTF